MQQVRDEARRRKIDLVALPTAEAISALTKATADTNAILHLTCCNSPSCAARMMFCHSVSTLLDKRLYRMRRFYFALASDPELPERSERIQACLKEYDAVLYEWNDGLNLNLALMGAYFGERAGNWLDFRLYEQFKQVGAELEDYYLRSLRGSEVERNLAQIKADLDSLGNQVHQLVRFSPTSLRHVM